MTAADLGEVAAIERLSHPVPWPEQVFVGELERSWAFVDVVRAHPGDGAGRIVAFCNYWLVHDEVHLLNLATHPEWRRRGIGTLLLRHLLGFSRDRKCGLVTLEVRVSNVGAQALYEAHGFTVAGVRRQYYADNDEDALVMMLELGQA